MTRSLLVCVALAACSTSRPRSEAAAPMPAPSRWKPVVEAPERPAADRALDAGRKPAAMLDFLDLRPGMKVAELGAGPGYTSELLARAVGETGRVWSQNPVEWAPFAGRGLDERAARLGNLVRVDRPFDDPLPPEVKNLDAVVMVATYHDVVAEGGDRARMNQVIFAALQPGGTFTVIDSSAKDGSGESDAGRLHRIDEQLVKAEVAKAGFRLVSESAFLRNPADARDWNAAPEAAGPRRGTSDRFALRFVRPEGSKAALVPPKLRLPAGAVPVRAAAELTIVPTQETFTGKEELVVGVSEPLAVLWLNADGLELRAVEPKATVLHGPPGFVGLAFAEPLPKGESTLRISWEGRLSSVDYDGAFRERENGAWYAITHLEPLGARRVLPCFDEPSFKIPWRFSLRVREEDAAYFNTPVEAVTKEPGGLKVMRFAQTRPLPSYLLAFGVGPYERVDAGHVKSGAPVGVVVTKGKRGWARESARSSPRLMDALERYFGLPYPYPKLDLIEIPLGTGAMENPGLITFNQRINLARPGEETAAFRRRASGVEAHEFAHLWFGDFVTTAWWDDIWLNEAFATWMESKILEREEPALGESTHRVHEQDHAMRADSLVSARRVRQPIRNEGDIKTAFDAITYQKGAAVIGMFERYVGEERFRSGVRRYLKEHADGNATAVDFVRAVSAEAGADLWPAFSGFLDRPGLPLVTGKVRCEGGKAAVELAQERYLPLGVDPARVPRTWQIPVCVRTDLGGACTLLTGATGQLSLDGCPAFLTLNAGAAGYYRSQLDGAGQRALFAAAKSLTPPERAGLMFDTLAAARAGRTDFSRALELAALLASDPDPFVVEATLEAPLALYEALPSSRRPALAAWVRAVYGERARALGFAPRRGEPAGDALLRPALLALVGNAGEDATLRAEARKVALAWVADRRSTTPELAQTALQLAALSGDQALWDTLHRAARTAPERADRQRLLAALGSFRDAGVVGRALPLVLSDEFDTRESLVLLSGASGWETTRGLAIDFVMRHFDALAGRLPRDTAAAFVGYATAGCDEERTRELEDFFHPRAARFAGGERRYAQAVEAMHQCAAFRARAVPSALTFLSN